MKKGICHHCGALLDVDESEINLTCPNCKEPLTSEGTIKKYYQEVSLYRRLGDLAFTQKANYIEAYKNYDALYKLMKNDLNVLIALVIAKLRSSTLKQLTIKDATDLLMNNSENIEITYDNVKTLSDFLIKVREEAKKITNTYQMYAHESNDALKAYQNSLNEYLYYLKAYLEIYQGLDKMSQYFEESQELINDEIKLINDKLKENIKVDNKVIEHDILIFPSKIFTFRLHLALMVLIGVGFVLSLMGLIFLSTLKDNPLAIGLTLAFGLTLFIGGYFLNHYIMHTLPNKKKH